MKQEKSVAIGHWGVDLSARDMTNTPGTDFYRYVNGKWLENFDIPADKATYGTFQSLHDQSVEQIDCIVDEILKRAPDLDPVEQKLHDLFLSYTDEDSIESLGMQPALEYVGEHAHFESRTDLWRVFAQASRTGLYSPIAMHIDADPKSPQRQLLNVGYGSLCLPDRDYYFEDTEEFHEIRNAFRKNIELVFRMIPEVSLNPTSDAEIVFDLEVQMAKLHWPRADLRDQEKIYNVVTLEEIQSKYPSVCWSSFFEYAGLPKITECNVYTPDAVGQIVGLVEKIDLRCWRLLLTYRFIVQMSEFLPKRANDTVFEFYGRTLKGQEATQSRRRRAIEFVSNSMGDVLGQYYVDRYFPENAKSAVEEIVRNILGVFSDKIDTCSWMSETTRKLAKRKLGTFVTLIGYPDSWKDYDALNVSPIHVLRNAIAVKEYNAREKAARLTKPTDRSKWLMTPQTVNAYYHPLFNQIVFPAAILQPPFFDPNADSAVNYGGIGAVIGHEIGHGFDDQGRKFDENGVLKDWWLESDVSAFSEATQKLIEQFDRYERLPGNYVNGRLTLGENVGDLGGITLAHAAYRKSLGGQVPPVIDGTTGDQRFFLSYGQIWRTKDRDAYALSMLKMGPHSPPEFRVNGAIRNVDAWYDAFDIDSKSPWYLPPEMRAKIW